MFDNHLFMDYDYGDDFSAELLRLLRQGTEIEEMKASEVVKFRTHVKDRVKELTFQLTKKPYFILAYRRDGVVRMTERFERMWKKKNAYWEDESASSTGNRPRTAKRRKRSKAVRAKTPVAFPNLREQDDLNVGEQDDMGSRVQLVSMAETALELSVGQEEEQEMGAEPSFFADAMVCETLHFSFVPTNPVLFLERAVGIRAGNQSRCSTTSTALHEKYFTRRQCHGRVSIHRTRFLKFDSVVLSFPRDSRRKSRLTMSDSGIDSSSN
jgi:hypothetical protein